ncbi:DUF1217 domain-containing protein [Sedimentimonas flavescens]|uniref:DUF1217 domain-containing protein n=1 Tax=Sedimentimonas flavescens TaxID=2851012 RepID=A0ABT2ZYM8_9RHOB|nr:DUF1217 domain-containing protein [Sedimentimonas flavescens]MCV2878854.1 DUF1217 domain-containing protein [Sedimentimonas flavescens]
MSYTPVIPMGGYAGWKFLNRTMEKQQAAFTASAQIQRNEDYFREKIGSVTTAAELVADRRLLSVALGAFGLNDDINNRYFIQKVLDEGSLDGGALANKLADKRYLALTKAFGFGDFSTPRTVLSDFPDEIVAQYRDRQFEIAVGEADNSMRLALSLRRDLPELAAQGSSEKTKWFTIIGSNTMSTVFRTALGLPESVSSLDVDQQLEIYRSRTEQAFGSSDPGQFAQPDRIEELIKTYLLRAELGSGAAASSQSIALQLLSASAGSGLSILL